MITRQLARHLSAVLVLLAVLAVSGQANTADDSMWRFDSAGYVLKHDLTLAEAAKDTASDAQDIQNFKDAVRSWMRSGDVERAWNAISKRYGEHDTLVVVEATSSYEESYWVTALLAVNGSLHAMLWISRGPKESPVFLDSVLSDSTAQKVKDKLGHLVASGPESDLARTGEGGSLFFVTFGRAYGGMSYVLLAFALHPGVRSWGDLADLLFTPGKAVFPRMKK